MKPKPLKATAEPVRIAIDRDLYAAVLAKTTRAADLEPALFRPRMVVEVALRDWLQGDTSPLCHNDKTDFR